MDRFDPNNMFEDPTQYEVNDWTSRCAGKNLPANVDNKNHRYPYAIAWTPLPLLTWIIPFIGHMGICNSEGKVFDFAGPYFIGEDDMAFGSPTRYLPLTPPGDAQEWDQAVAIGCKVYSKRMHNLCCDNCHSHVARVLNAMGYKGFKQWNMIILCFWVFFCGRFCGVAGAIKSFAPFCVILSIILVVHYSSSN